jgi:hypothetical protein
MGDRVDVRADHPNRQRRIAAGQGEKHVSGGIGFATQPKGEAGIPHQLVSALFAFAIGCPDDAGGIAAEIHQSGEQPLG